MIQGPSPKGQGPCSIRLQFMENIQTRFLDMKLFKFSVAALLAPVSYTHLDVYKRQQYPMARQFTFGLDLTF